MSDATPEQLATEAKQPGVFNILDVLNNRGYPQDEVEIVLDDNLVYAASKIDESIKDINKKLDTDPTNAELLAARESLIDLREQSVQAINSAKYVFTISGISEGQRDDLLTKVQELFPTQYEETVNPINGKINREEIENQERNLVYTLKLWAAHIKKITSPNGEVQVGLTEEEADALRRLLPIAATARISEAIERLRVATAMFVFGTDEDFLAKS